MIETEEKVTTASSILVILLRELRMERRLHQAQIADSIGKTASAWTKIEAGKSPLSFEIFLRVCNVMQVAASAVMATAERYAAMLGNRWNHPDGSHWAVLFTELELKEDALLSAAQEYWNSPGFRQQGHNSFIIHSILNGPITNPDGTITIAPVFQFALDPAFRALQLRE
ncbi:helix-turn-helix transcriptional regulator [Novosphingobium sp. 1949]|uniref:Helix-turn-helix transcriptional regulator n=1 Tax=Novosphingobium organovorum TaxID=2930092 RepID=A0ABT0BF74_9SPHN|nr:helix-turn-helix transcriptional regulator [Novosphingobium organovorum]MCJ2183692.1 helix-turn-helix transcriptional regulator [Novosphingobium organovorum]